MRLRGFTLVETLLVLVVASTFLLIGFSQFKKFEARIAEERFIQSFEQNYLYAQKNAIVTGFETQIVRPKGQDNIFQFETTSDEGFAFEEKVVLEIPASIKLGQCPGEHKFHGISGNNSTLSAYEFKCYVMKRTIKFQLQMGSGRYTKVIMLL